MDQQKTRAPRRVLFILIDGLGDVNLPQLNGQTPLQAAKTPAMDSIAAGGLNGLLDSVEPGLGCGSDTAHMSIFGYDPRRYYRGRGAFEVMGAGLAMEPGDIAFKSNFATIDDSTPPDFETNLPIVIRRRVDRDFPSWGLELCPYLDGLQLPSFPDVSVGVKYATEHRCGVRLRGVGASKLTDTITGTDPLKDRLPLVRSEPLDDEEASTRTAAVVNELVEEIYKKLSVHPLNVRRQEEGKPPANMVLLRGPGERISVQSFQEKHGMRAFMIAPTCIIAGLGMSIGIDVLHAPGATGDYHSNFSSKAQTAVKAFKLTDQGFPRYEFGFVHTKAVDDAGHDKDVEKKVHFLEVIDQMIQDLIRQLAGMEDEFIIVVTGDHSTPLLTGDHSFEPVPFAIAEVKSAFAALEGRLEVGAIRAQTPIDSVRTFDETAAAEGFLGRFPGSEVMTLIRKFAGRA